VAEVASAIIGVGLAFGLAHGLIEALPILSLFGIGLAWLRERTDSVYPPILLHAVFNGFALAVSVAL
jgi:membrane protease YdiL (CAAX protease family)